MSVLKEYNPPSPEELAEHERTMQRLFAYRRPATVGFVHKTTQGTLEALANLVGDLRESIRGLEAQIELLEHKSVRYHGVYQRGSTHAEGDLVTHRGGLWHAKQTTNSEPGRSQDWQLTAKTPQAARGAKA